MGPEVLEEWLRDAWQLGIGAFFGYLIIEQSWKIVFVHFRESTLKGIVTLALVASCMAWALSFINVTYIERWALGVAFEDYEKPPINFLHISLAIIFGILFAVLVSNAWRLSVVIPLALGLALADISGNATLINGVEAMRQSAEASGNPFGPPQMAWHSYYVDKDQLLRIYIYATVLALALGLLLIANAVYAGHLRAGAEAEVVERSASYLSFRYLAALAFCVAILGNLYVIWGWRLERECALSEFEMSFIYGAPNQCQ